MSKKRAKMLESYIEKKRRHEKRKNLFDEIAQIDEIRKNLSVKETIVGRKINYKHKNSRNDKNKTKKSLSKKAENVSSKYIKSSTNQNIEIYDSENSESCDEISIFSCEQDKIKFLEGNTNGSLIEQADGENKIEKNSLTKNSYESIKSDCLLEVLNDVNLLQKNGSLNVNNDNTANCAIINTPCLSQENLCVKRNLTESSDSSNNKATPSIYVDKHLTAIQLSPKATDLKKNKNYVCKIETVTQNTNYINNNTQNETSSHIKIHNSIDLTDKIESTHKNQNIALKENLENDNILNYDKIPLKILPCKNISNSEYSFQRTLDIINQRQKLPVFYQETEIISLIRKNTSLFILGNTGTGKTTQIPQFLLENNINRSKKIGITLPRRILAQLLSKRLNEETNSSISGYKIKYEDTTTNKTVIQTMTEGVLLREIQSDFALSEYSVLILDEIHERSANVDILLGILSKVVAFRKKQNSELKLLFMSANNIQDSLQKIWPFPIENFQVTNESHRVHIRYENHTDTDYLLTAYNKIKAILENSNNSYSLFKTKNIKKSNSKYLGMEKEMYPKIERYAKKLQKSKEAPKKGILENNEDFESIQNDYLNLPKDVVNNTYSSILCFLSSKDEIYRLKKLLGNLQFDNIEIIPFHSNLSTEEQKDVLKTYEKRKIILCTNIAESSITIPDVVFVIDSGRQKYKKYLNNNLYKYTIDFISKQSAIQRAGRCGRTQNGVCYRLYSSNMYECLEETNIPGILTEDMSRSILYLKNLGVPDIQKFPFITKPSSDMFNIGYQILQDIDAIDKNHNITDIGRKLCDFPLQPIFSRLITLKTKYVKELILTACIFSTEIETFSNSNNFDFQYKSDIIFKLDLILKYLNSNNKKEFLIINKLIPHQIIETVKLYNQLLKIYTKSNLNLEHKNQISLNVTDAMQNEFIIFIAGILHKNIAKRHGTSFFCGELEVFASEDSINIENARNVVFSHLLGGKSKIYMKNITIIDSVLENIGTSI